MYQVGHYGAALLLYAPLGAAVSLAGYEPAALLGGLVCVGLSTLPDCDHRLPLIDHRGPTHTLLFAGLVGGALAGTVAVLGDASASLPAPVGRVDDALLVGFAFVVGALSIVSHLLADALTPMGIRPFWPVSSRHYTLRVTRAANTIANYVLFAIGVGAVFAAVAVTTVVG
ncbi:metal-dependent hydrolase [Halopiger aswanensis]|uniref:Inner membrane protein n=1 Tax=Halopiger aswanensis TaxID=148449 RepID=A0A3R7FXS9_9EURY|nr:metal-dependent hydrolase [Halopiger aswanensis]RKD97663.1 inner membrane protein [Halopiger aswanensis]